MRNLLALASAFALSMLAVSLTPASAQQVGWRIAAREGVVRVVEPGQAPAEATLNQQLQVGATVTTGANSRATLENGAQRIAMAPNSRVTIAPDSNDAMTRILQDLGSLLFQVDRQDSQHFRVETPLLAAVVKGTTFTVTAGPHESVVHVAEGLVEVRANENSAVSDVAAGSTVRVNRDAPGAISLTTPSEAGAVVAAEVPALDYAAASGGVVAGPENAAHAEGRNQHALDNASAGEGSSHGNGGERGVFEQSVLAVRNVLAGLVGAERSANAPAPATAIPEAMALATPAPMAMATPAPMAISTLAPISALGMETPRSTSALMSARATATEMSMGALALASGPMEAAAKSARTLPPVAARSA